MGDRGTAKSVAVRSLIQLLPEIDVVKGDVFNSSPTDPQLMGPDVREKFQKGEALETAKMRVPMVEVPLGTTEDRICGTIDIEKALSEGRKAYDPGLLAKANRGLLYIDEVNLLDDSLVDVVLDSAAGGVEYRRTRRNISESPGEVYHDWIREPGGRRVETTVVGSFRDESQRRDGVRRR